MPYHEALYTFYYYFIKLDLNLSDLSYIVNVVKFVYIIMVLSCRSCQLCLSCQVGLIPKSTDGGK